MASLQQDCNDRGRSSTCFYPIFDEKKLKKVVYFLSLGVWHQILNKNPALRLRHCVYWYPHALWNELPSSNCSVGKLPKRPNEMMLSEEFTGTVMSGGTVVFVLHAQHSERALA